MTVDCDVCIIGGGITAALFAEKFSELAPGRRIIVVEAGNRLFDFENRTLYRDRNLQYGENAWPGDFIPDQSARGVISRTMAVGGSAMHWEAHANRFSQEDLRLHSLYGLATDWPLEWGELEAYYCEVDRRIGVAGDPSPFPEDRRSQPYPMPAMPLSFSLNHVKTWAEKSGIPFQSCPQAKNTREYDGRSVCKRCNTCNICPTGARYSPDFTFKRLLEAKRISLHDRTLVRRLITDKTGSRVVEAQAVHRDRPDEVLTYRADTFVLAGGYTWSPHLLLLSTSARFPRGLANSSGLVGRYMTGHPFVTAQIEMDGPFYPGMNEHHPLISRKFFRCRPDEPFVRHDIQIFESTANHQPRLRGDADRYLFGNELIADWRARASRGAARVRMYYDAHPDRDSTLTLDPTSKNRWGDPLPKIDHRFDEATRARESATRAHIQRIYETLARASHARILSVNTGGYLDHPSGGCRMGTDRASSVCDSYGRTHDHHNLFVIGAPTLPTGGCTNATMTFSALTLRSAHHVAGSVGPATHAR